MNPNIRRWIGDIQKILKVRYGIHAIIAVGDKRSRVFGMTEDSTFRPNNGQLFHEKQRGKFANAFFKPSHLLWNWTSNQKVTEFMGKLIGYLRPGSVHTADMNFVVSRSGFWVIKAKIIYKPECRSLFAKMWFHQFNQLVDDNYDVRSVWHICFFSVMKA